MTTPEAKSADDMYVLAALAIAYRHERRAGRAVKGRPEWEWWVDATDPGEGT